MFISNWIFSKACLELVSFQGIITEVSADILHRVGLQFIFHLFLILYNGMIAAVIIPVPPTMYYIHLHTLQHHVKSLARFSKIILQSQVQKVYPPSPHDVKSLARFGKNYFTITGVLSIPPPHHSMISTQILQKIFYNHTSTPPSLTAWCQIMARFWKHKLQSQTSPYCTAWCQIMARFWKHILQSQTSPYCTAWCQIIAQILQNYITYNNRYRK